MKKVIVVFIAALMTVFLPACGGETGETEQTAAPAAETAEPAASAEPREESESGEIEEEIAPSDNKVLVVVFSATGTTRGVAEKIASIENAEIYEIKAAQEYTDADLNWNDNSSRTTLEQNDKTVRPEIGSEPVDLAGYTTVYIGYPIWWGEEPRIMDTFVESYDFDGITMIPFCTSSSSGIGRSGQNLADNAGSGNWLDGERFSGSVSESELQSWIDSLR